MQLQAISKWASIVTIVDALFGLLLPLLLVALLVGWFGKKSQRRKDLMEIAPWTLAVGASYVATSYVVVRVMGVEFAAILGGLTALLVAVVTAYYGILIPKDVWREHARPEERHVTYKQPTSSLLRAWIPYVFVILALLLQRTIPALKDYFSRTWDLSWDNILGFEQIHSAWQFLLSPGTVLAVVALIVLLMYRATKHDIRVSGLSALRTVGISAMALLPTLIMVQIFVNSGLNHSELASMPHYLARTMAEILGPVWLGVSPIIGALTAFIVGSSTVSTLTMSSVQASVAGQLGLPVDVAMAQQVSGANAGNVIAIHNVVAASAVVGLHHQEGRIIRHTIVVVGIYIACSVAGVVVLLTLLG